MNAENREIDKDRLAFSKEIARCCFLKEFESNGKVVINIQLLKARTVEISV